MIGSARTKSVTLNPIEQALALCGLQNIAQRCVYMFYPAFGTDPDKRYYLYIPGVGWTDNGVTLTRPGVKRDVINSTLTSIAANQLGPNGRIDPTTVVLNAVSNDITSYTKRGTCELTLIAGGGPDGGDCTRAVLGPVGSGDCYYYVFGFGASAPLAASLYVKKVSGLQKLLVYNPIDNTCGEWEFSGLPTGVWVRLDKDSPYLKEYHAFTATAGGAAGFQLASEGGTYDVAYLNESQTQTLTTTPVLTAGDQVTRTADAWRCTGLSGVKSFIAVVRFPYASTAFGSDQYLMSLNGSDSMDNGIFLYTDSTDHTLHAAARSGGVSQGDISLGNYAPNVPCAIAVSWDVDGLTGSMNGVAATPSAAITIPASIDRVEFGRGISSDVSGGAEHMLCMMMDRVLTLAERNACGATFANAIASGLSTVETTYAFTFGDSLSMAVAPYIATLKPSYLINARGVAGVNTTTLAPYVASRAQYLTPSGTVLLWVGTGDVLDAADAATAYAAISAFCLSLKAYGCRVILGTVLPRDAVGFETKRLAVNVLLRANQATFCDGLADVGGDATIGVESALEDISLYADEVHLAPAGYAIAAPYFAAFL